MSIQDSASARLRAVHPGRWVVDPVGTTATFRARDVRRREVLGSLPVVEGHVDVDEGGAPVAVQAVLDVTGVATGIARRDRDLRSRRFFHADAHPTVVFSAGPAEPADGTEQGWTLAGRLLVRDVPCPLDLQVRLEQWSEDEAVVLATTELDRRDAGLRTAPGFVVGHRIGVEVRARLRAPVR